MKFTIKETQNLQSDRKGYNFEANTLKIAKKKAKKDQCFQGTVLKIYDSFGCLQSYTENGEWVDAVI